MKPETGAGNPGFQTKSNRFDEYSGLSPGYPDNPFSVTVVKRCHTRMNHRWVTHCVSLFYTKMHHAILFCRKCEINPHEHFFLSLFVPSVPMLIEAEGGGKYTTHVVFFPRDFRLDGRGTSGINFSTGRPRFTQVKSKARPISRIGGRVK